MFDIITLDNLSCSSGNLSIDDKKFDNIQYRINFIMDLDTDNILFLDKLYYYVNNFNKLIDLVKNNLTGDFKDFFMKQVLIIEDEQKYEAITSDNLQILFNKYIQRLKKELNNKKYYNKLKFYNLLFSILIKSLYSSKRLSNLYISLSYDVIIIDGCICSKIIFFE